MDQGTWAGIGAVAGSVATALGRLAWDKRKNGNGVSNGSGRLDKLEREVLVQGVKVDAVGALGLRLEGKLEEISRQIGDLREDVARLQ